MTDQTSSPLAIVIEHRDVYELLSRRIDALSNDITVAHHQDDPDDPPYALIVQDPITEDTMLVMTEDGSAFHLPPEWSDSLDATAGFIVGATLGYLAGSTPDDDEEDDATPTTAAGPYII